MMFYIKGVTLDSKPALNPLPTLNETGKGNTTNLTITLNSNITNGNRTAPFAAEFKGNASGGSAPYLFSWNFGDGGNNTAIGQIVSHAFTQAGVYNITLAARDSGTPSQNASASVIVTVTPNSSDSEVFDNNNKG